MDLVSGFPCNLAYTLKHLSKFTKQTVKVTSGDRTHLNIMNIHKYHEYSRHF